MDRLSLREMRPALRVTTLGIGVALYVAMNLALQVPFFENYYLALGYVTLAVFSYLYGPVAGAVVGVAGCVLHCLIINGLRGMPGWALGNLLIGLGLGWLFPLTLREGRSALKVALAAVGAVALTAAGILVLKSFTEVVLYAQPMWARMAKNVYAFVADSVVLLISIPFCVASEKFLKGILKPRAA